MLYCRRWQRCLSCAIKRCWSMHVLLTLAIYASPVQVLMLSAELDKQRKLQQTALEAQEAFHKAELEQVKCTQPVQ